MRKLTPWTRLYRRLEPLTDELHRATPWRVEPPETVDVWLRSLTWMELNICDCACRTLCEDPPRLPHIPMSLTAAVEGSPDDAKWQEQLARQVMHRLLFAIDLCRRMPIAYRRERIMTGEFVRDSAEVLISGWRSGAALYWAMHFGPLYCESGS